MTHAHPFLALTDSDREQMLGTIGVDTVDELFRDLPEAFASAASSTSSPRSPSRRCSRMSRALADRNADASRELSFLGAGIYDHYVPRSSTRSSSAASC